MLSTAVFRTPVLEVQQNYNFWLLVCLSSTFLSIMMSSFTSFSVGLDGSSHWFTVSHICKHVFKIGSMIDICTICEAFFPTRLLTSLVSKTWRSEYFYALFNDLKNYETIQLVLSKRRLFTTFLQITFCRNKALQAFSILKISARCHLKRAWVLAF